ncbi:AAA family ATPase [Ornithinibacillus sp. JPR2-1]|uniref:AAA family ATPase n=1 Tax=Ornithinibacillus sp. JPR2-1 TaxID=2094019 RepID=UPI0031D90ADF
MITQVSLKGFQSHVNSVFNLGQGLNVVTGPSDAGKTAIIRAVRWVAFNDPQGESFLNEAVGEAEVKITLANNAVITKTRRKGKTTYVVQLDPDDEGSVFEKSEVPLEVKKLLGIEKHSFGDFESALNFSFQLDAPFLISETASAGAKVLGKLAGTESVDLAIKGVSKDTYAARQLRTQAEKDMERITGSLLEYQGIDDAKQMLETAEMLLEQVEVSNDKFENLKEYKHLYELARERVTNYVLTIDRLAHVPALEVDLQNIEKAQQRYDMLLQFYSDGHRLQERINQLDQELWKFEGLPEASNLVESVSSCEERLSLLNILRQSYQKYTNDVKRATDVQQVTREIDTAAEGLTESERNLGRLIELRTLKAEYNQAFINVRNAESRLENFKSIEAVEEILTDMDKKAERLTELNNLQSAFSYIKATYDSTSIQLNRAVQSVEGFSKQLQQAWEETGGICPLCEQPLSESHTH